jgi:rSAM/selenodomain-associated transferase 2
MPGLFNRKADWLKHLSVPGMQTATDAGADPTLPVVPAADAIAITIIVPCWRGDSLAPAVAARWLENPGVSEVLVAAAESWPPGDDAAVPGLRTVCCTREGRGNQMNEAARAATGNVLLFQHADTELTDVHLQSLCAALASDATLGGGAFQRHFDERHPRLRWIEPWEALRCRKFGPLFGDQSIFVRRQVFEALGGFADIPLMEDVDFSCRMRRAARIALLRPPITSSSRKHLQRGPWRTTWKNILLLLLYICGVSPARLHAMYYQNAPAKTRTSPEQ